MTKGYVQVYTGNGKGKTTAALGLILRSAGAGNKIYLGQFIKKGEFSEIKTLKQRFPEVTLIQYGEGFIRGNVTEKTIALANDGYLHALSAVKSGNFDLVVLDEFNVALDLGLLTPAQGIHLINEKAPHTELVLTGRKAHPEILDLADLVSEILPVKHYYEQGVPARTGIEK